jgi:regulation of enolase protein 1 (concanavalin A-like superfamily)
VGVDIPGLPTLTWLDEAGTARYESAALHMEAGPQTDWFNDPSSPTRIRNAPALVCHMTGDFQLRATVNPQLVADFDAGVLFIHRGPDDYAKFCFERSPQGLNTIVSVVTRETSDDSNGAAVDGDTVDMRIARVGTTYAFHASRDGVTWDLIRLFSLRPGAGPTSVGFLAQSPTGSGCVVRFTNVAYTTDTLTDFRNGS